VPTRDLASIAIEDYASGVPPCKIAMVGGTDMSAVQAIKAIRPAGVELALDGDDLVLEAASPPPAAVLDALSRHKAKIVALLRPGRSGWSGEDWQVFFDRNPAGNLGETDLGATRGIAAKEARQMTDTELMFCILARKVTRQERR